MTEANRSWRNILFLLFAVSGFSGLLYESIWSHYLKLFLGHAAYAQTLVLAIFMGGMAIGAWLPSRYGTRWKNLLIGYAVVEGIIGLCAVIFHSVFVSVTDFAYDSVIPALSSTWSVNLFKWSLAGILILPQSVLLGMTFPLMSASLIRRYPTNPGASLAMLYFTNSLGAAIGVLVSGFLLIEWVGLPGTILTAGLINIVLALVVWLLARKTPEPTPTRVARSSKPRAGSSSWRLLIAASFVTGAASFIYEIGWIRMLSLVLGSSTHAFELMLSAFIAGLAFGGLWIRRRIDHLKNPIQFLGWIQVVMGLLALGTMVAYNTSFDLMQLFMRALTPTDSGYYLFNLASHGIALFIMVPVTFCAGMTLPLITHTLWRSGYGEKSIGAIYSANTVGAIVGVIFAVHIGLSALGLKGLIVIGAALDMALGIVLLNGMRIQSGRRSAVAASVLAGTTLAAVLIGVQLDRYKMASGVYRYGQILTPGTTDILYHKDGKTATVDLMRSPDGGINIATNGKSDAKINVDGAPPSADESTMTMIAAIALMLHPQPRTAANIGMGSGLTTHVLLTSTSLERVDTIEIEPAIIEAAQGFRPRVEAAFSDPRSRFHIDDAKTFFAAHQNRYDIIVSEPSNPWVSGVASLFSDEFYRRVRTHLQPSGLFVQWLQLYDTDITLVASVMKAVGRNFSDYALYAANDGDLLIVALKDGKVPQLSEHASVNGNLESALRHISIHNYHDLKLRYIGSRSLLEPLFTTVPIAVNSDFFPVLDLHAVRARFIRSHAHDLLSLGGAAIPALEMLSEPNASSANTRPTLGAQFSRSRWANAAHVVRDFYIHGTLREGDSLEPHLMRHILLAQSLGRDCRGALTASLWFDSVLDIMNAVTPHLKPSDADGLWRRFRSSDCYRRISPTQRDVFMLLGAIARRDARNMAVLAEKSLGHPTISSEQNRYLLAAGMLGYIADNKSAEARRLWKTHASRAVGAEPPDILLRLLLGHSFYRDATRPNVDTAVKR